MHDRDSLHRFMFEQFPIRGHLVHLDASWRALIEHGTYPASIRTLLGETVVASVLLAATIKFDGLLSLEMRGDGPVHLLLAQCTSGLGVRGLARHRDLAVGAGESAAPEPAAPGPAAPEPAAPGPAALIGAGNLTVTLESEDGAQRYQGIVPITGERLADSLQGYFENSEQLPTRLWLHADEHGAAGMLLQRLPAPPSAEIEDAWRRVQLIGETLTSAELKSLADTEILHRLFNEDDVRLYEPAPVFFRCRCSRERVSGMLQGLGAAETRSILAERGTVEVRCDFCNRAYVFDAVDVEQLFKSTAAAAPAAGDTGTSLH